MKKLYIIGNGFDMHHGLKTGYLDYAKYIKKFHHSVYEMLIENFPLSNIEDDDEWDPLWARFEASLGELYSQELLDKFSEFIANPGSDDFKEGDYDAIATYIEQDVDKLLQGLRSTFLEFISSISFPSDVSSKQIQLDSSASFINFNYTNTLERYYNIQRNSIIYIHNRSGENEGLILGHAVENPEAFPKPKMPEGLTEEQKEEWFDYQSENFDLSIQRGQWEIETYFSKSLKKTKEILKKNEIFFQGLQNVEEIFVIGHSISKVDHPYFLKIADTILKKDALWNITYYAEHSILELKNNLAEIGIEESNVQFVKIMDL